MRFFCLLLSTATVFCGLAPAEPARFEPDIVVTQYVSAFQAQQQRFQGATMEVDIEAELPKLKRRGRLQALRKISEIGRITYEALRFEGDRSIKTDVIARYLTAETENKDSQRLSMAITPENYKFKFKGMTSVDGRSAYNFQVSPKKKRVGLFNGELLIDAETYLPLRESGRFVKNPSIFLKRVEFVREYDIRDGVSVPRRIQSNIDTRIVGKAQLSVAFGSVTLADTVSLLAGDSGSSQ